MNKRAVAPIVLYAIGIILAGIGLAIFIWAAQFTGRLSDAVNSNEIVKMIAEGQLTLPDGMSIDEFIAKVQEVFAALQKVFIAFAVLNGIVIAGSLASAIFNLKPLHIVTLVFAIVTVNVFAIIGSSLGIKTSGKAPAAQAE